MNEMIAHRIVTIGLLSLTLLACTNSNPYYQADKAHHTAVGFINSDPSLVPKNWLDVLHWRLTESPAKSDQPISIPRVEVNLEKLRQPTAPQATWIGHSTMLVQSDGLTFLTDPIFSERASPLSFVGPKRHQPPALSVEQLPPIDVVLISHSHYDHLDEASVKALAQQPSGSPLFLVPLGVEKLLHDWGISRVMALDWWDSHQLNQVKIHLTPAQHWSARGLFDKNETLWGSWTVIGQDNKWIFAGDTGYTPEFKKIRERLVPEGFDLALIPIGAYQPRWFMRDQHIDPAEAVDLHQDLGAKQSIAIHWGTFSMADELLNQPPTDLANALKQAQLPEDAFRALAIGETLSISP